MGMTDTPRPNFTETDVKRHLELRRAIFNPYPFGTAPFALRSPRYDTELYPSTGSEVLSFFTRPLGSPFMYAPEKKILADTNMVLSGRIQENHSFSVLGVGLHLDPQLSATELRELLVDGLLSVKMRGSVYLELPIIVLGSGSEPNNLTLGKEAVRLRNDDQFEVLVKFSHAPKISHPARIVVVMRGFYWMPEDEFYGKKEECQK